MPDAPPPISVQLYSLREQVAADFPAVLARLGAKGYAGVELAGFGDLTAAQLADALSRAGLVLSSAHVGYARPDEFAAALDDHRALGCDTAVVPAMRADGFEDLDAVHKTADRINRLVDVARERGMTLGYHNHWWELQNKIGDRTAFEVFADLLDPAVQLEVDLYWATAGGADLVELLRRLVDRVVAVHVKDGPMRPGISARELPNDQQPAGQGDVPLAAVLTADDLSIPYAVLEFDHYEGDVFDGLAQGYTWLKQTLA